MRQAVNVVVRGLGLAAVLAVAPWAQAAPMLVNELGVTGWSSGDTRPAAGGAANPGQIAAQIRFLGEGVVAPDAAGATPDASPTGTAGGLGAVRLDGTNGNPGKSDIGYLTGGGIAASALLDTSFSATYRYFVDENPTSRTLGFGIRVSDGSPASYVFSHVRANNVAGVWQEETVNSESLFRLYDGPGAPGGTTERTLEDWAQDAAWSFLFDVDYEITRFNFNIGSSQRNVLVYVDWFETNLLADGERFDFVDAAVGNTVPEPGSLALLGLGLAGLVASRRRRAA